MQPHPLGPRSEQYVTGSEWFLHPLLNNSSATWWWSLPSTRLSFYVYRRHDAVCPFEDQSPPNFLGLSCLGDQSEGLTRFASSTRVESPQTAQLRPHQLLSSVPAVELCVELGGEPWILSAVRSSSLCFLGADVSTWGEDEIVVLDLLGLAALVNPAMSA